MTVSDRAPADPAAAVPPSLRFRRPAVRDLAWLVFDGALRLPADSGVLATVSLDEDEKSELLGLLAEWDQDSGDNWLGPIEPRLRLGLYTERLIGAWLRHSRLIRLVAMNWPLRVNRITAGEADFLVERLGGGTDSLQLWELACKFYLGVPGRGWLGPGLNDSLAAKLSRVRSHQLQLIHHAGFRAAWGSNWAARAWISGWLMEPAEILSHEPDSNEAESNEADANEPESEGLPSSSLAPLSSPQRRIAGVWAEAGGESIAIAERRARDLGVGEWWLLPKRRWLRPALTDEPVAQRFASLRDAASFLTQTCALTGYEAARPLMLAGVPDPGVVPRPALGAEALRLVLVPAGWTQRANRMAIKV